MRVAVLNVVPKMGQMYQGNSFMPFESSKTGLGGLTGMDPQKPLFKSYFLNKAL